MTDPKTHTLNYHGESINIDRQDLDWVIRKLQAEYRADLIDRRAKVKKEMLQAIAGKTNAIDDAITETYSVTGGTR
mgnify:CR=1 FL=1